MKKMLFFAALALVVLQACETTEAPRQGAVSEKARLALEAKYPGASDVSWLRKNGYVVATFINTAARAELAGQLDAWFDNQGAWYMTETDLRFEQLPNAIQTAFATGIYAQWRVDDVDMIERMGAETVYVVEVEQAGKEMDLYYSPDGVLVKEMADVDDDYDYEDYIPSTPNTSIEGYLQTNHPGARILEIDREDRYTEVEILDGRVKRELIFDGNTWVRTKTELRTSEVPAAIMQVLQASAYASYRIDDVDHYTTTTAEYYRFELESAAGDVKIEITAEGMLTLVGSGSSDDDDYSGSLTQTTTEFIAKQYPGAHVVESEYENGYLEVEIRHDNREKTVRFNASNAWVDTRWDIRASELPQAVKDTIATSAASYVIDDVECIQTPAGDYYEVELEKGDREKTMHIKADGTVM